MVLFAVNWTNGYPPVLAAPSSGRWIVNWIIIALNWSNIDRIEVIILIRLGNSIKFNERNGLKWVGRWLIQRKCRHLTFLIHVSMLLHPRWLYSGHCCSQHPMLRVNSSVMSLTMLLLDSINWHTADWRRNSKVNEALLVFIHQRLISVFIH